MATVLRCEHCSSPIPPGVESTRFCCHGCESVAGLLKHNGLERYYALAGRDVVPASVPEAPRPHAWLSSLLEQTHASPGEVCRLQLDVQGIHCTACVWLMNETFRRREGAGTIIVNPTLGTVDLSWQRGQLDPEAWVTEVEGYGYQFGPARKVGSSKSLELPLRLGISAAITINVMLFSVSFYMGLTPAEPGVFALFTWLSAALSTVTVLVGGWPFFRAVRAGFRHLDVPIAMGIALVYGMSVVQLVTSGGRGDLTYFDTLNTFITLMLLGRFLQERILERNRRFLLEDDGADGIVVRRRVGTAIQTVPAPRIAAGDELLIAPGELVPVDAQLLDPTAQVSTDWVTGEAEPRVLGAGQTAVAGSFNAGRAALRLVALQSFKDSQLVRLLRQPAPKPSSGAAHHTLWATLTARWVTMVLSVSALGFLIWLPRGPEHAVNVAASLLVITCPCAIGIALPLAYELTQSRLRRRGFYVRGADLLDRLLNVGPVVFDKTGTLTVGRLELGSDTRLEQWSPDVRNVAYNLAVRSSHPVSTVLARALERHGARFDPTLATVEVQGQGIEATQAGERWRLGRAGWALDDLSAAQPGTVLSREGKQEQRIVTREVVRPDAKREVAELRRRGHDVWILSGDTEARAAALASALGFEVDHAVGGLRPEEKAERVRALGSERVLYVGDGVNDALAFEAALAAGTPAIDRPVMPSKSDFFLVGEGLSPIVAALDESVRLRRVVRRVLAISLTYNVLAICGALAGLMSPLVAAIFMPSSTLSLIALTFHSLSERRSASGVPAHALSAKPSR